MYDSLVTKFGQSWRQKRMKNLKQWLMVLMASFMLVGVTVGCSNAGTETEDTETEDNQTDENETETETEGTEDDPQTEENEK